MLGRSQKGAQSSVHRKYGNPKSRKKLGISKKLGGCIKGGVTECKYMNRQEASQGKISPKPRNKSNAIRLKW